MPSSSKSSQSASKQPAAKSLYETYKKLYFDANGREYEGSVKKDIFNLIDVVKEIGGNQVLELIEFYFTVKLYDQDFQWFIYHYDELRAEKRALERDRKYVAKLRENTRKVMDEVRS